MFKETSRDDVSVDVRILFIFFCNYKTTSFSSDMLLPDFLYSLLWFFLVVILDSDKFHALFKAFNLYLQFFEFRVYTNKFLSSLLSLVSMMSSLFILVNTCYNVLDITPMVSIILVCRCWSCC